MREENKKELERMLDSLEYMTTWISDLLAAIEHDSISRTKRAYRNLLFVNGEHGEEDYYSYESDVIDRVKRALDEFWEGGEE